MATFDFQSFIAFDRTGNSLNFQAGTAQDVSGTLDDNDPGDDSFQADEIVGTVDGDSVHFIGVYAFDGVIYPVLTIDGQPDTGYLVSPLAAADSLDNLPTVISTTDDNFIDAATPYPTCFAAGTLVATPTGEQRVETLKIGDQVLSMEGRALTVRWIGRQTVSKVFTPADRFSPVKIRAGALGEAIPHRDLVVTPDHGILVGGTMVNAGILVNGTSIVRVPKDDLPSLVTYYHVELENHELVVANGVPAETFIDATTRGGFDNYGEFVALFGEPAADMMMLPYPRALSHRQLSKAVRDLLAVRAAQIETDSPRKVA